MSNTRKRKEELRSLARSIRGEIALEDWEEFSSRIKQHLINSEIFDEARQIHCYVSMNDRKEVDTSEIIEDILLRDKVLSLPVTNFSDLSMKHFEIESRKDLKKNKWGIREPVSREKEHKATDFDLVLVPMLAADPAGNRLGYGKGFYDRFLKEVPGVKVGLTFDALVFDSIPSEETDIRMDYLITETGMINTKQSDD